MLVQNAQLGKVNKHVLGRTGNVTRMLFAVQHSEKDVCAVSLLHRKVFHRSWRRAEFLRDSSTENPGLALGGDANDGCLRLASQDTRDKPQAPP